MKKQDAGGRGNDVWPGKEKEMSRILRGWCKGGLALDVSQEGGADQRWVQRLLYISPDCSPLSTRLSPPSDGERIR